MDPIGKLINLFFLTHRSMHKHMQECGVISVFSILQFMTMKYVRDEGPVNMKDIAKFLSITPASATSLVNGLERAQMLERVLDRDDKRVIRLRITTHGRRKLREAENRVKGELRSLFLKLKRHDQNNLMHGLEKLYAVLIDKEASA